MRYRVLAVLSFLVLITLISAQGRAADDGRQVLASAMKAEIDRSMDKLELEGFDSPYFISYELQDVRLVSVEARYGGLTRSFENHHRTGYVEVRVGGYEFDNSGKGGMEFPMGPDIEYESYLDYLDAPLDLDTAALRRMLWRVTDLRYKEALSSYQQKQSRRIFEVDTKVKADDFSREKPQKYADEPISFDLEGSRRIWEGILREESEYLNSTPGLIDFEMSFRATRQTTIFVSSEGSSVISESLYLSVSANATTRADDGMLLINEISVYGRDPGSFPDQTKLHGELARMVAELDQLRNAPVIDPYTGPAILGPEVAGVFFHEAVGHRLEGERQRNKEEGQTFANKIGERVIPEFLTVVDDPTMKNYNEIQLNGWYDFDDEGIPGQRVVLIQDGVLRNYLLSRTPIEGFDRSNGHGRSDGIKDPMARMSNTIVISGKTMSREDLKAALMDLARQQGKPYGLIIEGSVGGQTSTKSWDYQAFTHRPLLIYKVDARTGEETLVRGAEIVGTPLVSINKIVATGADYGVFNGYCGAESGYVPVSAIAPSILVTEVELQKIADKPQRPPLLPPPPLK